MYVSNPSDVTMESKVNDPVSASQQMSSVNTVNVDSYSNVNFNITDDDYFNVDNSPLLN